MEGAKERLISSLISSGYLKTPEIIRAFKKVKREDFVPNDLRRFAYVDEPLPIGHGQTISQPLTVAAMTEALGPENGHKVLEIGAGSGYQAAILAEIAEKVITIERIPYLAEMAKQNLRDYKNVFIICADGSKGWEQEAPYDRIIVTASAPSVPEPLLKQLKTGGRIVIPVGNEMWLIEKTAGGFIRNMLGYYAFVPLIGEHGHR